MSGLMAEDFVRHFFVSIRVHSPKNDLVALKKHLLELGVTFFRGIGYFENEASLLYVALGLCPSFFGAIII